MPKAILALRSYPLAFLVAMLLFICSLLLATSSTGIIGGGGGDDGGSGMGGTGKSGLPGDSGFGGTGGPRPFLGELESDRDPGNDVQDQTDWPAPWLPREIEISTIPEEILPLQEIQRNPLRDPTLPPPAVFPDNPDVLRIIEQDNSGLPSHLRQQLDLANSGEIMTESAPVEIRLQIPEIETPTPVIIPLLQRQTQTQQASVAEAPAGPQQAESEASVPEIELTAETEIAVETETNSAQSVNSELAGHSNEELPEILTETPEISDPRETTERIQRPELPPFQRVRPAVDRASIVPPRPQPMRI